jgi:transcriptional regulator with XRE-family HTH domain
MPHQKDPRIPSRTPEQIEEERRFSEEFHKNPPRGPSKEAVRTRDLREFLRLVGALKKAREQQGLTLAQLAERCGMDEPSLSRLLSGNSQNPTLSTLFRVAAALGKDLRLGLGTTDVHDDSAAPSGKLSAVLAAHRKVGSLLEELAADQGGSR